MPAVLAQVPSQTKSPGQALAMTQDGMAELRFSLSRTPRGGTSRTRCRLSCNRTYSAVDRHGRHGHRRGAWTPYARPSTSLLCGRSKDVDARDKRGHDVVRL